VERASTREASALQVHNAQSRMQALERERDSLVRGGASAGAGGKPHSMAGAVGSGGGADLLVKQEAQHHREIGQYLSELEHFDDRA
jgi:hypothetical protein